MTYSSKQFSEAGYRFKAKKNIWSDRGFVKFPQGRIVAIKEKYPDAFLNLQIIEDQSYINFEQLRERYEPVDQEAH